MNTTLRTVLATALSTAAFIAASPVQAGAILPNGPSLNGLATNGLFANGLGSNGMSPKGILDQIPDPQGETRGASRTRLPEVESIVLKDGRELPAR
jgi:hypothetical protein